MKHNSNTHVLWTTVIVTAGFVIHICAGEVVKLDNVEVLRQITTLVTSVDNSFDSEESSSSREARHYIENLDRKSAVEALFIIYRNPNVGGGKVKPQEQSWTRKSSFDMLERLKVPVEQLLPLIRERWNEISHVFPKGGDYLDTGFELGKTVSFLAYHGDRADIASIRQYASALARLGTDDGRRLSEGIEGDIRRMREIKRRDSREAEALKAGVGADNGSLAAFPKMFITSVGDGLRDTAEDHGWIVWLLGIVMASLVFIWWLKRKPTLLK